MSDINYWKVMTRKKPMPADCEDSKFSRVFGTFDLTALGVSATLGVGVYVLAGHVAKLEAGPSVILSFFIAAAASFLAGLCYAEFASRVPKSGSAYVFTYVAIGEFVAFIIGWNLLLEYIIGSASIAKGLSLYIDSLVNNTMKNFFMQIAPISFTGSFLSSYFDFFAFACPLVLGFALAFGLKKSAGMNNVLCILNLCVVFFVIVVVLIYANIDYWRIDPSTVADEYKDAVGSGGFFPFGFSGTIKGAATCFFGFVGFDCIATTGEEVRNPRKSVPRAILFSLIVIFLAYFGVSLLTLMWPYYLLNAEAPLPHAFNEKGLIAPKWIVSIGGIVGLIASLFGAMFGVPRILYAMSIDGLIFKIFGVISSRFKTPVVGTLCAAALTSCFAGLFDLKALVNMLSIGVLLAYTVVAISIIILRYSIPDQNVIDGFIETSNLLRPGYNVTLKGFFMQLIRLDSTRDPNTISATVVGTMISFYCVVSFMTALLIMYEWDAIVEGETWVLASLVLFIILLVLFCLFISVQPRQVMICRNKPFQVPFVPFLPAISVFINIYLMLMLDYYTWIRFGVWMMIGFITYFPYAWHYHRCMNDKNSNKIINCNGIEQSTIIVANTVTITESPSEELVINEEIYQKEAPSLTFHNSIIESDDTHLVIEILDTVLEEEERDTLFRESSQSINEDATVFSKEVSTITELIEIDNVKAHIDEILDLAAEIVSKKQNDEKNAIDDNKKTVFQNENFLTHLSDVILSNRNVIINSQTLQRQKKTDNVGIKLSSSAPNLQEIKNKDYNSQFIDSNDDKMHDDEHRKADAPKIKEIAVPVMPLITVYNTELLEKFEEMKEKRAKKENSNVIDRESSSSDEEELINKEQFREKLEKLLSEPPIRLLRPVPVPRISLRCEDDKKFTKKDSETQFPLRKTPNTPTTPMSATMQRQKLIFDEVLKNIKKEES